MAPRQTLTNLRNILATLYDDEDDARRVADDAGLDITRIKFEGSAINIWQSILKEAESAVKMDALLRVVVGEYGTNLTLKDAVTAYRQQQGTNDTAQKEYESSATTLSIQNPLDNHIYLIEGSQVSNYKKGDSLVVYDEIAKTEISIAHLKVVTDENSDSLSAQAILIHPTRKIVAGLRVDGKLRRLSTTELIPAFDYAIGYLLSEGRVRVKIDHKLKEQDELVSLEPILINGTITDHLPTDTRMRVTKVGQGGAVVGVALIDGGWSPVGTLVQSAVSPVTTRDLRSIIVGGLVALVGVVLIIVSAQIDPATSTSIFLLLVATAIMAVGIGFLGGSDASARGNISVPILSNYSIKFNVNSSLAAFIIVLIVGTLVFLSLNRPGGGESTPTPTVTPVNVGVLPSIPTTVTLESETTTVTPEPEATTVTPELEATTVTPESEATTPVPVVLASEDWLFFKEEGVGNDPSTVKLIRIYQNGDFSSEQVIDPNAWRISLLAASDETLYWRDLEHVDEEGEADLRGWEIADGYMESTWDKNIVATSISAIAVSGEWLYFIDVSEGAENATLGAWRIRNEDPIRNDWDEEIDASQISLMTANTKAIYVKIIDSREGSTLHEWRMSENGEILEDTIIDNDASRIALMTASETRLYWKDTQHVAEGGEADLRGWVIKECNVEGYQRCLGSEWDSNIPATNIELMTVVQR